MIALFFFSLEPMTGAHLMVLPITGDISEGNSVTLICSFIGTPPVTVRWFRGTNRVPLETTTTNINTTNYPFKLSKWDSGEYYCEAENSANSVKSNSVKLVGETDFKHSISKPACLFSFRPPNSLKGS